MSHESSLGGLSQGFFHPGHALPRRLLWSASLQPPVRLERARATIAVALQCAKLTDPVDGALPHRRPLALALGVEENVLAVDVAKPILRQLRVAVGERGLV